MRPKVVDAGANVGALTVPLARAVGPRGVVHATGPVFTTALAGTRMKQFSGYVEDIDGVGRRTTARTDEEIERFSVEWCKRHPTYNPAGPNCQ